MPRAASGWTGTTGGPGGWPLDHWELCDFSVASAIRYSGYSAETCERDGAEVRRFTLPVLVGNFLSAKSTFEESALRCGPSDSSCESVKPASLRRIRSFQSRALPSNTPSIPRRDESSCRIRRSDLTPGGGGTTGREVPTQWCPYAPTRSSSSSSVVVGSTSVAARVLSVGQESPTQT